MTRSAAWQLWTARRSALSQSLLKKGVVHRAPLCRNIPAPQPVFRPTRAFLWPQARRCASITCGFAESQHGCRGHPAAGHTHPGILTRAAQPVAMAAKLSIRATHSASAAWQVSARTYRQPLTPSAASAPAAVAPWPGSARAAAAAYRPYKRCAQCWPYPVPSAARWSARTSAITIEYATALGRMIRENAPNACAGKRNIAIASGLIMAIRGYQCRAICAFSRARRLRAQRMRRCAESPVIYPRLGEKASHCRVGRPCP
jgi:hypothetical protein